MFHNNGYIVTIYPCKCHDFVNFMLTTQFYNIFSLTTKISLHYHCRNFPNGQPDFPNILILKIFLGGPPPNTPLATALGEVHPGSCVETQNRDVVNIICHPEQKKCEMELTAVYVLKQVF